MFEIHEASLDSRELLAVKQVSIAANTASKEKTQAHIQEIEEEVKLLKNLSSKHCQIFGNCKRGGIIEYFFEFVPGGSISSLLGKFRSFLEAELDEMKKRWNEMEKEVATLREIYSAILDDMQGRPGLLERRGP